MRYQELEWGYRTNNYAVILKRIEKKNPAFFEVWGELVEYMLNDSKDYQIEIDDTDNFGNKVSPSFCLGVDKQEDYTYIWYVAFDECQKV